METAPYVPFRTFIAALEGFERSMPNQVDRSLWPSYSGAIRGQLLAAFRFLGFVDEGGCPAPALREAVSKPEMRKAALRSALERNYQPLLALDLTRTSPHQLEDKVRDIYGISGATHKKAVSFFLHAAQYSGLPLSQLLRAKTRTAGFGRRKTGAIEKANAKPASRELSKTVNLKSGGTVMITASVDLFSLSPEDRKFVFDLVDRMQAYR